MILIRLKKKGFRVEMQRSRAKIRTCKAVTIDVAVSPPQKVYKNNLIYCVGQDKKVIESRNSTNLC